jgi:hypothetical protein
LDEPVDGGESVAVTQRRDDRRTAGFGVGDHDVKSATRAC